VINHPKKPKYSPPPEGVPERRQEYRREEDVEMRDTVEHAVKEAPLVHRLLRTGKVASAIGAICIVLGGASAAFGYRLVGPTDDIAKNQSAITARVDVNSERITHTNLRVDSLVGRQTIRVDSLLEVVSTMRKDLQTLTYIQCVQLRRNDPDLLPDGCSPAAQRNRRN
jgi:hypothetical protein